MLAHHFRSTVGLGHEAEIALFAEEIKAQKVDYETGIKQLTVVRRFRNPVLESLARMKASGVIPADIGVVTPGNAKSRPQSRRNVTSTPNGPSKDGVSQGSDDKKPSPLTSRPNSRGHGGRVHRVHFQRQGSHDDIGITPSAESPGAADDEEGVSPEEAIMRRIWNSREVYDPGEASVVRRL